jgi:hypothetical protein
MHSDVSVARHFDVEDGTIQRLSGPQAGKWGPGAYVLADMEGPNLCPPHFVDLLEILRVARERIHAPRRSVE